jgi:hypothetical protein
MALPGRALHIFFEGWTAIVQPPVADWGEYKMMNDE